MLSNMSLYYLNIMKRETIIVANCSRRSWYRSFFSRHPELTTRIAQNLSLTRVSVTEKKLRQWFEEVGTYIKSKNLINIDPSRQFNADESAFALCPKADFVLMRKKSRSVYKVINGDEKETLTVNFTFSGSGMMAPLMVLHWYQRLPSNVVAKLPKDWSIGTTEKGWMTAEAFYEYVINIFHPWLVKTKIEFPVILHLDGHSSHATLPLVEFCLDNKIELIALYPNAKQILQPLDVSFSHPLKNV